MAKEPEFTNLRMNSNNRAILTLECKQIMCLGFMVRKIVRRDSMMMRKLDTTSQNIKNNKKCIHQISKSRKAVLHNSLVTTDPKYRLKANNQNPNLYQISTSQTL